MRFIGAGTREGFEYTLHETFWTVPNVVTVLRFLLVPVFVWLVAVGEYFNAFWVLVALSSTDWVDGYIARRFDQQSTVGEWLDPLADRVSMTLVTLALVVFGVAPLWVVLAVAIPDLILFITFWVLFKGDPRWPSTMLGKIRTACLMIGAPLILLASTEALVETALRPIAELVLAAGCLMHIIASIDYLVQARRKARQLRSRGIRPRDRARWVGEPGV